MQNQILLGTIQVLRQHVFGFLGPPTYISINSTVNQQKLPFSESPANLAKNSTLLGLMILEFKKDIHFLDNIL